MLTELQKSEEVHCIITQKQSQVNMTKKYLKKAMYFQKKDKKLLIIWDWYNSIIIEYQKLINLLENTPNQPTKLKLKLKKIVLK